MTCVHTENKTALAPLRAAMYTFDETGVRAALGRLIDPNATIYMPYPLGDMQGPEQLYDRCYRGLFAALPDLERRDWIVMGGETEHGGHWVGCGGHYVGTFVAHCRGPCPVVPVGHPLQCLLIFWSLEEGSP